MILTERTLIHSFSSLLLCTQHRPAMSAGGLGVLEPPQLLLAQTHDYAEDVPAPFWTEELANPTKAKYSKWSSTLSDHGTGYSCGATRRCRSCMLRQLGCAACAHSAVEGRLAGAG